MHAQGILLEGRYRVLRHLGSGGMASVLLCRDERLDRLVAVKRLHADSPDDVERRFVREAKLGASLNHPNLVSVFDTATDDEGVLIVMEYVRGEPLSHALRGGPLEPERVARMASELGHALDHAHKQGVVHRDVKPSNVLLREDGVTKLVDLGIATASDQTRITRSGTVLGTAAYMAPEQLEGHEARPPADVYALAAVCFEALTGQRARSGLSPVEIAHRIATEAPPDLREQWPGAPPAAAEVLRRAMAREPDDRPVSAGELGDELRRALEAPPARTATTRSHGPETATAATRRPHRARRPSLVPVALAAAFVALAAAIIIGVLALGGGDDEPSSRSAGQTPQELAQPEKEKKDKPKQQAEAEEPAQAPAPQEGKQPKEPVSSGVQLNDQGYGLMQQGRYDEAVPILREAVASWPEHSRGIQYAYALFNLGKSLNRSGNPDEAIPYLEKRLTWDDQQATVRTELELARRNARDD